MHVADFIDPLRSRVMRSVGASRRIMDEERHRWTDVVKLFHPVDGVVGHRGDQIVMGIADVRVDRRRVAEHIRLPLAGVATNKAVEVLETHAYRPLSERPRLARLKLGCVVVLPEPCRPITVFQKDPAYGRAVRRDDAVVALETCRLLRDDAKTNGVVIAPGEKRRPRGRAQCSGMEVRVTQPVARDAIQRRRWNHATERARSAETDIVRDDEEDVRSIFRRSDTRRPIGFRLRRVHVDLAAKRRIRSRKITAIYRLRRVRRAWGATDLPPFARLWTGIRLLLRSGLLKRPPRRNKSNAPDGNCGDQSDPFINGIHRGIPRLVWIFRFDGGTRASLSPGKQPSGFPRLNQQLFGMRIGSSAGPGVKSCGQKEWPHRHEALCDGTLLP